MSSAGIADEIVDVLLAEPLGLSARTIASRVHRRRGDVVTALRSDARFAAVGENRGSRWRVRQREPQGTAREPQGPHDREGGDSWVAIPNRSGLGAQGVVALDAGIPVLDDVDGEEPRSA
jgi:hypothetical protein